MKFTDSFLNDLRNIVKIEELIGDYVPLKKQGKSLSGCCPFHVEKTPSFHVSPTKKLFHCFGCGKGGDAISFIIERENYPFIEAVKHLADRYNIPIPESAKDADYDKRVALQSKILKMNRIAADYWISQLEKAQDYLETRATPPEIIESFEFGCSLDSRNALIKILKDAGFTDGDIMESGLVVTSDNGYEYFDRFRNRLMIPIMDVKGRVVAFGGRTIDNAEPKYLNSPETALYVKGEHLYGLHQAKDTIRTQGYALLTEGYFDTITLHQNGILNVVASLGTGLTTEQVKLLKRFTDKVLICYDGDQAGQLAAEKASELFNTFGFTVKVLVLPDNLDPDEYVRTYGRSAFDERRKRHSLGWFNFYIERVKHKFDLKNPKLKSKAVEEVLVKLSQLANEVERRDYFDLAMRLLKIDPSLHSQLWAKLHKKNKSIQISELVVKPSLAETRLLDLVVCNDTAKDMIAPHLKDLSSLSITPILTTLSELPKGELNFAEVVGKLTEDDQKRFCGSLVKSDETLAQYESVVDEEIECCIEALKQLKTEIKLDDLAAKIKLEEDPSVVEKLLEEQLTLINS